MKLIQHKLEDAQQQTESDEPISLPLLLSPLHVVFVCRVT